jgi:triosephosphate isomerase
MARTPLVVGNWKMNTGRAEAIRLAGEIAERPVAGVDLAICPPFPWLVPVADAIAGSAVELGAQDCWTATSGAFTGAVSPGMLAEICRFVIVGHSERRTIFGESDELVDEKITAALAAGLLPILCVGEDLETRRSGDAVPSVKRQLQIALAHRPPAELRSITVAYEPIWAIGTGVAAQPGDAEEMSAAIRTFVSGVADDNIAGAIRILYGGSVTPANAAAIFAGQNVDGALVGGASLKAESFLTIAAAAV